MALVASFFPGSVFCRGTVLGLPPFGVPAGSVSFSAAGFGAAFFTAAAFRVVVFAGAACFAGFAVGAGSATGATVGAVTAFSGAFRAGFFASGAVFVLGFGVGFFSMVLVLIGSGSWPGEDTTSRRRARGRSVAPGLGSLSGGCPDDTG